MGSSFSLILILLLGTIIPSSTASQTIKSPRLLDLAIRDYAFKKLESNFKTGIIHSLYLPANLSGIDVETARYRCGSLSRYGAKIKEFYLSTGVAVHPCVERVVLIRQKLSLNWSNIYYNSFDLDGYQLIYPILGLLAYNAGDDLTQNNPFELSISSVQNPIRIDFTNFKRQDNSNSYSSREIVDKRKKTQKQKQPYCASFEIGSRAAGGGHGVGGKVTLANLVSPCTCVATKQDHFGLVIEETASVQLNSKKESKWKVAVGSAIGAALGAFLLGLLLIAMFVKAKKRSKMEEIVRRTYEEEALQVSMVGHVRAPTAPGIRTTPIIEHQYRPPRF